MSISFITSRLSAATGVVALFFVFNAYGQQVEQIVDTGVERNKEAKQSQARVDRTAGQTEDLLAKFKAEMKVVDGLKVYNTLLGRQVQAQIAEMQQLDESIAEVSVIERQITPLMIRMLEGLEHFVELDVPFLMEERRNRVARLNTIMERANVTAAEKFRAVVEAYQIESEFGRTIEAYKGSLDVDGQSREVDFLRIGRVALVYQSVGAEYNGVWNQKTRTWNPLDATEYRNHISKGLKIARKQVAPDLLMMPIAAAEAVQ